MKNITTQLNKKSYIAFASGLILIIAYIISGKDCEPADDSDLQNNYPILIDSENAYTYLLSLTNFPNYQTNKEIVWEYSFGENRENEKIAEILKQNEKTFEEVQKTISCKGFILPEPTHIYSIKTSYIASLVEKKAIYEINTGNYDQATKTVIMGLDLGNIYLSTPQSMPLWFSGIVSYYQQLSIIRYMALDNKTPIENLKQLQTALENIPSIKESTVKAVKAEYIQTFKAIDKETEHFYGNSETNNTVFNTKFIYRYYFQPNNTKQFNIDRTRYIINNLKQQYYIDIEKNNDEEFTGADHKILRLIKPNVIGRLSVISYSMFPTTVHYRVYDLVCQLNATKVVVAIAIYKKENGKYPEKLEDLVPECISTLPMDPYNGKPFQYDPTRQIIYSVRENLQDDGGIIPPDDNTRRGRIVNSKRNHIKSEDDIFRIEMPKE